MGKNKLEKFADMAQYPHVFQHPFHALQQAPFALKGKWHEAFFHNNRPIVIELGCGRGEYTVALAKKHPEKNFIGIDIKGARMWNGATQALQENLPNVAFLRTEIELITHFFEQDEVDEIWVTFPDPQMKKRNKRLTSTPFIHRYAQICRPQGKLNLKTDSNFLYTYTKAMAETNHLHITAKIDDVDRCPPESPLKEIRTYYEQQWRDRGITIKYLCLELPPRTQPLTEPEIEIELDDYRSYNRSKRSSLKKNK